MPDNVNPTIFLSYSWKNVAVADEIDNDFKSIGITFKRDVRDAPYRTSIKEFMQQIGKTDFVLMIISDEYLRSENCMYEVTELLNTHEFNKRILPILLDDARHIFKATERTTYYDYWKEKFKHAQRLKRKYLNQDYVEHEKKYKNICNNLDGFFSIITDLNVSTYENIKKENYRPLLNIAGFEDENLVEEVLIIDKKDNIEEKELAIEEFLYKYPNNKSGLFLKAYLASEKKEYIKACKYYENLLEKYPLHLTGHNNLAGLLSEEFGRYDEAKEHIDLVLKNDPADGTAYYNLGLLLDNHFHMPEEAKKNLEKAIIFSPKHSKAHNNLALLLIKHFSDYVSAKKHLEEAIAINPNHVLAYSNLGLLLSEQFFDYVGAKKRFLEALNIDSQHFVVHNNLAVLLTKYLDDDNGAKFHYEKTLSINPKYAIAHFNLCILLKKSFSDYETAKQHYLTAVTLDSSLKKGYLDKFFNL